MIKKDYNKYTSFIDKFPFIIVAFIAVLAVILIFQLKARYPLPFFSVGTSSAQSIAYSTYPILVATPSDEEVFDFVSKNRYVPIEVKSKAIEKFSYKLNLVINDRDTIKTFSSPPYKHNWRPNEPGEYVLVANLVDSSNQTLSSSNKIKFVVNLKYEDEPPVTVEKISINTAPVMVETAASSIPIINLQIYEGPTYSVGDDICYYRVIARVSGYPAPVVSFSKDDSNGVWGPLKTQVNLTRDTPNYTLTATATNSAGQVTNSINLSWGCE